MNLLISALEWVMNQCYHLCRNYGLAIILFTLISKVLLMPISIWVQKNSIKMIRMQPEINFLKVNHYGDRDAIAEGQSEIYKREKYSPIASVVPMLIQLLILMGLIEVIKRGFADPGINMMFLGVDLSQVPAKDGWHLIWSPLLAGFSAWLLCVAQNKSNVLQSEQGKWNKYLTMALSVVLSLYLGCIVSVGVAIYWMASNLLAIAVLYFCNWLIKPRSYVDYEALEESRRQLAELESVGSKQRTPEEKRREKEDYKRFFKVVNKHLVFYSEGKGFYKYFRGTIEYLMAHTKLSIHYITSDPNDTIFELAKTHPQIKPYYIGEKRLITLMMKMDADVVVMTMPDLENFHIKRSYVRKDIEYIFIPHGIGSNNLTMRTASMDHFDTIFCVGKHQKEEVEKTEEAYGLPKKTLVEWGYTVLDEMRRDYMAGKGQDGELSDPPEILIAPSWQKDNIVDLCLEEILEALKDEDYHITVRPHPQQVRMQPEKMERLKARFEGGGRIEIQTDFSSNSTVFNADLLITDWSGIGSEYLFTTEKQVLYIDTPMKVMNPEYQKIDTVPFNIWIREEAGRVLDPSDVSHIGDTIREMLSDRFAAKERIENLYNEYIYHPGESDRVGAEYIIGQIQKQIDKKKGVTK